jgi:hypothetical protein
MGRIGHFKQLYKEETFMELTNLNKNDAVRITPENAIISEPLPKWFSGYPEPTRHIPDYYARTVQFVLDPQRATVISVRRSLTSPSVSKEQIVTILDMESTSCEALFPPNASVSESQRMTQQAQSLANTTWNRSIGPLTIRGDPGDVRTNEFQATVEVWCNDDTCVNRTVSQLEVRLGKPPAQILAR